MSYSRWGSPGLGWYIYHDTNGKLFVSPGCPSDMRGCPLHSPTKEQLEYPNRHCWFAEFLDRERAIQLKEILEDALDPSNDEYWKEFRE